MVKNILNILNETLIQSFIEFSEKEKDEIKSIIYNNYSYKSTLSFKEISKNKVCIAYTDIIRIEISKLNRTKYLAFVYNSDGLPEQFNFSSFQLLKNRILVWYLSIKEDNRIIKKKNILSFSKNFYSIYEDGIFLEKMGSPNAGMLYRKAIEYLVIDYLYFFGEKEKIKNLRNTKSITAILKGITFSDKLIKFINNNISLGNNFSHHREEVNIEDLSKMRENINSMIEHFDRGFEYEKYSKERDALYIQKNEEMRGIEQNENKTNS